MTDKTLQKPSAFQDVYTRKPGADQNSTHYCAGCGHGVSHKIIAEALSDLGLADRAIFAAPVGCAVFLYYYFNCAAVSVPHGRAPASLTGISRAHPDSICISYQGDGDLAAIGTAEILHAANRGEKIAVFFINNAIYGMTGGQMAPTTLIDMRTTTSPRGRTPENDGYPMKMSEMISTLEAPVYVERVSLDSPKNIMKTRRAVRKALKLQDESKGFTFVEILSPCPTNWRVDPAKANEWMQKFMLPVFPLGVYKDVSAEAKPRKTETKEVSAEEIYRMIGVEDQPPADESRGALHSQLRYKFAGFGGQGVLSLGVLVSQAAMRQGYHVTWLPSYGPEMRGGTANSSVIISDCHIGSPLVTKIDVLLALNAPSLEKFLPMVAPGGMVVYNASIIQNPPRAAEGVRMFGLPAQDLANEVGEPRAANSVMLGAYIALTAIFDPENVEASLHQSFPKEEVFEANRLAVKRGAEYVAAEGTAESKET